MTARGLTAFLVVSLLLVLSTGCAPTEEKCRELFPPPPEKPIPGPDGPIIIIKPGQSTAAQLDVHVGGQVQAVDSAISVFANYPNCELRGDFIGIRSKRFEFYTLSTANPVPGTDVSMKSATHRIDIVKTAYNTFHWRFQELTGQKRACAAMPVGGFPVGKVPIEFKDLLSTSLQDAQHGNGDKTVVQAYVP